MKMKKDFKTWCIQNQCLDLLHYYELAKNDLKSDEIACATAKVVSFKCNVCNLTWDQPMNRATRKPIISSCPYCNHRRISPFYNFEVLYPNLSKFWDYDRNTMKPNEMYPSSKKTVYWKCAHGHTWKNCIVNQIKVFRRNNQDICPICFKRKTSSYYNLMITHPEIARQWDYAKNAGLSPENFAPAGNNKVWWICDFNPNHKWATKISNRTVLQGGCPICAKEWKISYPALVLFYYLYQVSPDAACEVPFGGKYKIDILLKEKKIAIEHNGFYYHDNQKSQKKDFHKIQKLREEGYRTLTIQDSLDCKKIRVEKDIVTYPFERRYLTLDEMILTVLKILDLPTIKINHKEDKNRIDCFYHHIRKMQTLAYKRPDLAKEWSSKNENRPDTVIYKSSKKVWWKCSKCDQEYQAAIVSRVNLNSGCPYCANMKIYERNCLATKRPDLVEEWFQEKNGDITPQDVGSGTELKVWWKCKKGHIWKTSVYSRTGPQRTNCPYCSHNLVSLETSLHALYPNLLKYWNFELNGTLNPKNIAASSNQMVWWKCERNHTWMSSPNKMNKIRSEKYCPYCYNRKVCPENSFEENYPKLVEEWDYEKNSPLRPAEFTIHSRKKVWWKRDNLRWCDSIYNRAILGKNEPVIKQRLNSGENLLKAYPDIAAEWFQEKNGKLQPGEVFSKSGRKVWWKCKQNHEWQAVIAKRTVRGDGCPYCSGRKASETYSLESIYPEIALEWNHEKNKDLKPHMVTPKSGRKVWWKCAQNHEWQASIVNRTLRNHKCPFCPKITKYTNLEVDFPEIAQEWDYEKNEGRPADYKPHSNKKVWWKCKYGHSWQTTIDSRTNHSGCPICYKESKKRRK